MTSTIARRLALAALLLAAPFASAQTTVPGAAIDLELYNANDGSNAFCVAPGDTFWANLYIRPATGPGSTMSCSVACGSTTGGPGSPATAAVDVGFASAQLAYFRAEVNTDPTFAAVDGLVQDQNLPQGRIGWALAGDWTPNGNTSGTLGDPCEMLKINRSDWVVRLGFNVLGAGQSVLAINAPPNGPLSFADVCGTPAYTASNGGIDEVVPATVSTECPSVTSIIFRNGVETGDSSVWTSTTG
jgi:hypothetical protein